MTHPGPSHPGLAGPSSPAPPDPASTTTDVASLTREEMIALADCEQRIEQGMKTFIEVGMSLAAIRAHKLYRAEHATFETYCSARWNFTGRRGRQLIEAAEIGTVVPIENENQARALARVPEPDRAEVWADAVESTGGKPTAAAVRKAHERTQTPGPSDAAVTPSGDPGTNSEPGGSTPGTPPGSDHTAPKEDAPPLTAAERADLDDQLAHESERRAAVRNLKSVLTYLVSEAIAPAELAKQDYLIALGKFTQRDLDFAAETMTAIAALKKEVA